MSICHSCITVSHCDAQLLSRRLRCPSVRRTFSTPKGCVDAALRRPVVASATLMYLTKQPTSRASLAGQLRRASSSFCPSEGRLPVYGHRPLRPPGRGSSMTRSGCHRTRRPGAFDLHGLCISASRCKPPHTVVLHHGEGVVVEASPENEDGGPCRRWACVAVSPAARCVWSRRASRSLASLEALRFNGHTVRTGAQSTVTVLHSYCRPHSQTGVCSC